MKARRGSFRSIPPWWANPIVLLPLATALGAIVALVAVAFAASHWPP